ncbi:hypothetical protein [Calothrix sp. NIES-2098]|uniref:hypothetical protein n=1 Tax=Calothrix sp. NIES-2098 TaxID=1954171 RepID=UPI000B5FAA43|nr:hypothetical protein NIES2098_34590 [Calothrix sp. NIES-2098]
MTFINEQRRSEEGIQETRLVQGEETARQPDADSNSRQSSRRNLSDSKHQQVGSHRDDDQRKNGEIAFTNRGEDTGKIRERLKLVEESFLTYVHNHQQCLEARLDESRSLEQNFLTSVRELERDIDSLTSTYKELDNSNEKLE